MQPGERHGNTHTHDIKPIAVKNNTLSKIPVPPPSLKAQIKPLTKAIKKLVVGRAKRKYVLDTNVLMHDPTCIFKFQEHDVIILRAVLEELDNHKKGHEDINRNVREVFRTFKTIFSEKGAIASLGVSLEKISSSKSIGKIFLQANLGEPSSKADNVILNTVKVMQEENKTCEVVLVTKDNCMQVIAFAMGILAEDYSSDRVVEDTEELYRGAQELPHDFWSTQGQDLNSWQKGSSTFYKVTGAFTKKLLHNEFVYTTEGKSFDAQVITVDGRSATLRTPTNYMHHKVWGINARNREQNYALNLLLDPDIDIVSISGCAGSGKTLLALASALEQTLEMGRRFSEIIFTRATVSVGDEIGFLPGTEEEKMDPWMGALRDNLEFLSKKEAPGKKDTLKHGEEFESKVTRELIENHVKIRSMSFVRGRSFFKKFVIIDEFQNLTPKQAKTLITRAGPDTKIVCLGNLSQIDTPYLTEGSSGLAYLVDRFKGWKHHGHITLKDGERSRLANHANKVL